MSTVATVSLAIIAATCVIAVVGFVWFLVLVWGVVARVERIFTRVDREILGDVVRTLKRLTVVVGSGIETLAQVQNTARRVAQGVLYPPVAAAWGLVAAIREGLNWIRPEGDGKGGPPRSHHSPNPGAGGTERTREASSDEGTGNRGRDE